MRFFAQGTPVPQGSKRGFAHPKTGKVILIEQGGDRHKSWRQIVANEALKARQTAGMTLLEGPLRLTVEFLMPRPKSKPKAVWVDVTPDCDKLVRSVGDSLSSILMGDDKQIVQIVASKRYVLADEVPGCWIEITAVDDAVD